MYRVCLCFHLPPHSPTLKDNTFPFANYKKIEFVKYIPNVMYLF